VHRVIHAVYAVHQDLELGMGDVVVPVLRVLVLLWLLWARPVAHHLDRHPS
jgi:hypothetical protein